MKFSNVSRGWGVLGAIILGTGSSVWASPAPIQPRIPAQILQTQHLISPSIRVRVSSGLQSTWIRGKSMKVLDSSASFDLPNFEKGFQLERKRLASGDVVWTISASSEESFTPLLLDGESIVWQGEDLHQGKRALPSKLNFQGKRGDKKFEIIVTLGIENYLMGVLPKEMPLSWPDEALKAQAVAARSYALFQKQKRKNQSFDVESTIQDQVYEFQAKREGRWEKKLKRIIQSTRGLFLVQGSQSIKAYFHADCGGITELASNVWGQDTSFNGQVAPCAHGQSASWKFEIDKDFFVRQVFNYLGLHRHDRELLNLTISQKGSSGRVHEVKMKFSDGSQMKLNSQALRELVGFTKIKSTQFDIKKSGSQIVFSGEGRGHGVGMCQLGAKNLAQRGVGFKEILRNYYPETELKVLNL